jgi:hypothetical protein
MVQPARGADATGYDSRSMRRAALIAGVLALLGAVGLYLFRPAAGPVADATVGGQPGATAEPPGLQTAAPPSLEARASRTSVAAGGARGGEESAADDAEPIGAGTADDPVVCRVTFVGDGPRPSHVDLEVYPSGSDDSVQRRAPKDAWEVRLPRAPAYSVNLTLDGWESDQSLYDLKPTEDDRLDLEVRLPSRPSILVVEDGTGTALPEGTAREVDGDDSFMNERPAPRPESLTGAGTRADAAGLILLPKTAQACDWWVGAPDHAWVRLRVSPDDVARRVALPPGGALRVEVEGVPAGEEAMVGASLAEEKERLSRQALLARDADSGRHSMEGLAPGRWVVSVGRKADLWVREPWVTAEAEVVAGRTTDVRLVVPPRDPKASRPVEFELVVPAGWTDRPSSINLRGCSDGTDGIDRSIDVPGDASLPWRVRVEGLKDGPYQVEVSPYGWSSLARVRRDTTVLRIEIPAPAAVRIRVIDAKDGKPLSGASVYVAALDPWESADFSEDPFHPGADEDAMPNSWSGGGMPLREGKNAGTYEAQVFAGEVSISVDVDGYTDQDERITLPASATVFEHVFRLSQGGTIDVRIVSAGRTFEAAEGDVEVEPKRNEGDEEPVWSKSTGLGNGKASFDGLPPGTYVVSWTRPNVDVPTTKDVTIRSAGETVKVDLEAPPPPK